MKRKIILILGILILALAVSAVNAFSLNSFVAENQDYYSYTTAICEDNSCADFLVECNGDKVVSNSQITGWITFSENWEDPREYNKQVKLCAS